MILTIGMTAKAVGLSKTTICKHIETGKISAAWNKDTNPPQREIDASEIMRVYGVDVTLPASRRPTADTKSAGSDTTVEIIVKAKDETISALKAEISRLAAQIETKDEQIAAANRLLAAPKSDDRYAALLEKMAGLQRELSARQAEADTPVEAPPAQADLVSLSGREVTHSGHGFLAKLLPAFFGARPSPETKAA
jgi:uncharacterized small protein (DUF1192 family)